jgi:hypothetical protein
MYHAEMTYTEAVAGFYTVAAEPTICRGWLLQLMLTVQNNVIYERVLH